MENVYNSACMRVVLEEDVKGELENENRPEGIVVAEVVVDAVTIASRR